MEIERLALTVVEAAKALGIGRTNAYELIRQGKIPAIRFGRRILIPRRRLEKMLEGEDWGSNI